MSHAAPEPPKDIQPLNDSRSDERFDLAKLAVKRPLMIMVFNLMIVLAGLAALMGVEVRELPDVDQPIISVRAVFPGAAPETMDSEVTSRLEDAVARVGGLVKIESASEENNARMRLEFDPSIDLDSAASEVREAVSSASRDLPDRVEQITVSKADNDARPMMRLAISSATLAEDELTQITENDIIPELLGAPGVASISTFGTRNKQMRVEVDPVRLARFELTIPQVATALQNAPFDEPVGSFRSQAQELVVRAEASATRPDQIARIRLTPSIELADVADVQIAPSDATSFTRLDKIPVIGLGIVRQASSNTVQISQAINKSVQQINQRYDNLQVSVTSDDAQFIEVSVKEVLITLLFTSLVVIGVIWLFFGSLKATLIPAVSIPICLIGVIAGIWLMGYSINLLTLLALVLATGLIVDDSIVVLENILRFKQEQNDPQIAAVLGTRQVFFAVIATTAVLVSVFIPISFLPSQIGRLFREFGFVLALGVIISSFVSLSLVPALASRLGIKLDTTRRPKGKLRAAAQGIGGWLNRIYSKLLTHCLKVPLIVIAAAALVALACAAIYPMLGQELVPREDRSTLVISATGPDGVGLDYMQQQLAQIEQVIDPLVQQGLIRSVFSIVGRYDPNRIQVTLTLAPWEERALSQDDIANQLRGPLAQIPGSRVNIRGDSSLSFGGGGEQIEVDLRGSDYQVIYQSARQLAAAMDEDSGGMLSGAEISYQPTQPQLSLSIDRLSAAELGVDLDDLAITLSATVGGRDIADLNSNDESIAINLRTKGSAIRSPSDLAQIKIAANEGLIPLSSLVTITEEGIAAELDRSGQRRSIQVSANVQGAPLADALALVDGLIEQNVATGVDAVYAGEAERLQETSSDVLITYAFALVIVFLVLIAQFEGLVSPLTIMITVPFALAAALLSLFIGRVSLNIYSQIGLVMLIGIMAKNGILVVEFADQLRRKGYELTQAIHEAATLRLRPIGMTLISTVLGALPLVIATGAGAEARRSIGWVIFGGLGIAGVFTLILIPVIYLVLHRLSGRARSQVTASE